MAQNVLRKGRETTSARLINRQERKKLEVTLILLNNIKIPSPTSDKQQDNLNLFQKTNKGKSNFADLLAKESHKSPEPVANKPKPKLEDRNHKPHETYDRNKDIQRSEGRHPGPHTPKDSYNKDIKESHTPSTNTRQEDALEKKSFEDSDSKFEDSDTIRTKDTNSEPNEPQETSDIKIQEAGKTSKDFTGSNGQQHSGDPSHQQGDFTLQSPQITGTEDIFLTVDSTKQLEKIEGQASQKLKQSPAIAFISGQLQHVDPLHIPNLVSENPFIKQSLETSNIDKILNQPLTIEQILESLNVDQKTIKIVENMGFDLNHSITPKQLFEALGLDVQRIKTEFSLLKANLQLEGLQGYMDRAKAMNPDNVKSKNNEILGNLDNTAKQVIANGVVTKSSEENPYKNIQIDMKPPKTEQTPQAIPTKVVAQMGSQDIHHALESQDYATYKSMNFDGAEVPLDVIQTKIQETMAQEGSGVTGKGTNEDPFANIRNEMFNIEDVSLTEENNGPTQKVDAQKLIQQQSITKDSPLLAQNMNKKAEEASPDTPKSFQDPNPFTKDPFTSDLNGKTQANMTGDLNGKGAMPSVNLEQKNEDFFKRSDVLNDLQQSNPMNQRSGAHSGNSGSSSQQSGNQESLLMGINTTKPSPISNPMTPKFDLAPATQPIDKVALIQQIMEKSSMMIKDGGGSVRIEMGNGNLGKLDVAINLQDNKLDLRIIASSEQVRDMLIKEMPKLKDELIQQNLSLDSIEVGVGGESSRQESSGNGRYAEREYSQYRQLQNQFRGQGQYTNEETSHSSRFIQSRNNGYNHNGSISVMA